MKPKYAILTLAFITSVLTGVLLSPAVNAATGYDDLLLEHDPSTPTVIHYYTNYFSATDNTNLGEKLASYSEADFASANYGFCGTLSQQQDSPLQAYNAIQRISEGYSFVVFVQQNSTTDLENSMLWVSVAKDLNSPFTVTHETYGTVDQHYLYLSNPNYDSFGFVPRGDRLAICEWPTQSFHSNITPLAQKYPGYFQYAKIIEVNKNLIFEEGYEGYEPQPPIDATLPKFGYAITDGELNATYLRNLDLDTSVVNNGYKWTYRLYQTDDTYSIDSLDPIDTQSLPLWRDYSYKPLTNNHYVLNISLSITPPAAPRPDIKTVTFNIDYTGGGFVTGSTQLNECDTNGVCQPSSSVCNTGSVFQQMSCNIQKQLSLGIINPSITAFKNLLLAFTVPNSPTCSVPLTNVSIGSQSFPLSNFSSKACSTTSTFRETFPIVPIITNAIFAISILAMIVGMINRLTDKQKNNLIEGV